MKAKWEIIALNRNKVVIKDMFDYFRGGETRHQQYTTLKFVFEDFKDRRYYTFKLEFHFVRKNHEFSCKLRKKFTRVKDHIIRFTHYIKIFMNISCLGTYFMIQSHRSDIQAKRRRHSTLFYYKYKDCLNWGSRTIRFEKRYEQVAREKFPNGFSHPKKIE